MVTVGCLAAQQPRKAQILSTSRRVHKIVHHYLLRMTGGYLTVEGDPDQEPEDVFWIPLSKVATRLSYPNEQKLGVIAEQLIRDNPDLLNLEDVTSDEQA